MIKLYRLAFAVFILFGCPLLYLLIVNFILGERYYYYWLPFFLVLPVSIPLASLAITSRDRIFKAASLFLLISASIALGFLVKAIIAPPCVVHSSEMCGLGEAIVLLISVPLSTLASLITIVSYAVKLHKKSQIFLYNKMFFYAGLLIFVFDTIWIFRTFPIFHFLNL